MKVSNTPSQLAESGLSLITVRSLGVPTMPEYDFLSRSIVSRSVYQVPGSILRTTLHSPPLRTATSLDVTLTSTAVEPITPRPR